jgi:hypothetical protein
MAISPDRGRIRNGVFDGSAHFYLLSTTIPRKTTVEFDSFELATLAMIGFGPCISGFTESTTKPIHLQL